MAEKSVMAKSGKSNQKKQSLPATKYQLLPVDAQTTASQRVFDALPLAIVSVDWGGQIQYMNRAAKTLLGEPDRQIKLEEWPQIFGLYLDDGQMLFPDQKLPLVRALRGEEIQEPEGEDGSPCPQNCSGMRTGMWTEPLPFFRRLTTENRSNFPAKNRSSEQKPFIAFLMGWLRRATI
jgi:PAS domain-containing protein